MWSGFWQGEGGEQTCSTGLGWILVTRSAAPSWCLAGTASPLLFHGVTPAGWGGALLTRQRRAHTGINVEAARPSKLRLDWREYHFC